METQSRKYEIHPIAPEYFKWCAEVASVRMLTEEVGKPELVHIPTLYLIVRKMYMDKTAFVVTCNGEPVGAIGGLLHPNILNPDIATLTELMWFVLPEYRKTRAGAMLLNSYTEMADSSLAHYATISLLADSPVNFKSIEKRGFVKVEQGFRKDYEGK